jgi:hypothetical protein
MRLRGLLLGNHLHAVFLVNDDHLRGNSRWHRNRGWCSSKGCTDVSSVVIILILIVSVLIIAVVSILIDELHDELVTRLDHSFQLGLLFPQLLDVFSVLLA